MDSLKMLFFFNSETELDSLKGVFSTQSQTKFLFVCLFVCKFLSVKDSPGEAALAVLEGPLKRNNAVSLDFIYTYRNTVAELLLAKEIFLVLLYFAVILGVRGVLRELDGNFLISGAHWTVQKKVIIKIPFKNTSLRH